MLDVRRLVLLRDLAEHGTVTAVAQLHRVTASAVSQQLKQLEAETGVALFHRGGRSVRLTAAAHTLVEDTENVLAALQQAGARLHQSTGEPAGPLRLTCFTSGLDTLIAPLIGALHLRHPGLTLQVTEAEPEQSVPALRQQHTDVAIIYRYAHLGTPAHRGMETHRLMADPLLVVLPDGHPAAAAGPGQALSLGSLADTPWIVAPEGSACRDATFYACHHAGFTPQVRHTCTSFSAMVSLAATSAAAVLVPSLAARSLPGGVTAHRVDTPNLTRTIEAAVRHGAGRRPAVGACLAALGASAAPGDAGP
ncbi:LysR family transcriptional regulator [Streptomyces sp. NPDC057445]|uniref:LysR family transcriptional regulator n=1 Tax=Streptomyces sp. NPDC057445 TaxID=3346136 RepID=UPI0036A0D47A